MNRNHYLFATALVAFFLIFKSQKLAAQNPCVGPNLWQNGSFENIDNPLEAGWNPDCYPTNNNYPTIVNLNPNGYYPSITNNTPGGNQFLWFDNTVTPCNSVSPGTNLPILTQQIPTVVGETYIFSFHVYQHCIPIEGEVGLSVNGQVLITQTTNGLEIPNCTPGWQLISVTFTATTSMTTLQLLDIGWQSWGHDYAFDDMNIQKTSLNVIPPAPQTICEGECATLSIGGDGTQFFWNTGDKTPSIQVCPPATTDYWAIVSNNDKCVDTVRTTVFVNPKPAADAGSDQIICEGMCATIGAAGNPSSWYFWSNFLDGQTQTVCPPSTTTYSVTVTNDFDCQSVDSVKVTVIPPPQIEVLSVDCQPNSNFYTVKLFVSGGGQFDVSAGTVIDSGSTVIVFNIPEGTPLWINVFNGICENTFSVTSPDCSCPSLDAPQVTGGATLCEGDPMPTLSAFNPNGYQVSWYTAAVGGSVLAYGDIFSPKIGGTFYAQFTDSLTECPSARTAVTVTVNPKPKPDLLPLARICKGECATATASGGDLYLWSNGLTGATAQFCPPATDSFSVKIFNNFGCSATAGVKIEVADFPKISMLDTVCSPDLKSWSVVGTAAPALQIFFSTGSWQATGANFSVEKIDSGDTLLVSATNGTQGCLTEMKIAPPPCPCPSVAAPISAGDIVICENENLPPLQITGSNGLIFNWFDAPTGGTMLSSSSSGAFMPTAAGAFFVEAIDPVNDCASARISVKISLLPVPTAEAGLPKTIRCREISTKLEGSANGGGSPLATIWTTPNGSISAGQTSLAPTVEAAGWYFLEIENLANGCRARDSVFVEKNLPPQLELAAEQPRCFGDLGKIEVAGVSDGQPPYLFSLDTAAFSSNNIFENMPAGKFKLKVRDAEGCESSAEIALVEPPQRALALDSILQIGFGEQVELRPQLFNFSPGTIGSIAWSPAQFLTCADCLQPTTKIFENTNFTLILTDTAGCPAVARVLVEVGDPAFFVPNVFAPGFSTLENDVFTLFSSPDAIDKIEWLRIYDRWGELVFENREFAAGDFSAGWDGRFRGRDAQVGVYVWTASVRLADGSNRKWAGDLTLVR